MNRAASTDYDGLYGQDYFAHQQGASSFNQTYLPKILQEFCAEHGVDFVIDIGAGNGLLGQALRQGGMHCLDVDINNRNDPDFVQLNMALSQDDALLALRDTCTAYRDGPFLVTCLDMAEHVDIENLADFIHNLADLIVEYGIISISTRPSSRANLYHASVLPIDTWTYMFGLLGLEATFFEPLQAYRSNQQFRSDSQELLAVSHWQKRNIFKDDPSHQHYLLLKKSGANDVGRDLFRARLDEVLDIGYRRAKRQAVNGVRMPLLIYHVSFVQDWVFLRSLLDIWPASAMRVLIRSDLVVPAFREMMESFLKRMSVDCVVIATVAEGEQALEGWQGEEGALFVTATEGLATLTHGVGTLVALAARRLGFATICLQHGHQVPKRLFMGSRYFGAVDERAEQQFKRAIQHEGCTPLVLGSLNQQDGLAATSDPDALAFRLGGGNSQWRKRVLVGTNLHWSVHSVQVGGVFAWLKKALSRYPDILFVLRPHPDDYATFSELGELNSPNLMIIDQVVMMCIDWPVSRLMLSVDAVISTHSTLVEDALNLGCSTGILPTMFADEALQSVEADWMAAGGISISSAQLDAGEIPHELFPSSRLPRKGNDKLSGSFLNLLIDIARAPEDSSDLRHIEATIQDALVESCKHMNFDSHPNNYRQIVGQYLSKFVCR